MSKKLAIVGTLIVLIILTVSLCSASASSAAPRYRALRYRVIGHMKHYDVVRGHHRTLRVGHHRSYVDVNGVRRYRIVKRQHRFVVLRRVASAAPPTTSTLTFNVMDYGAHADGKNDDSDHIKAAVDACSTAGGGTVYIPAGTYLLTNANSCWYPPGIEGRRSYTAQCAFNILDNVTVRGAGPGQTILKPTTAGSSAIGGAGRSNLGLEDLEIDMDGVSTNGIKFVDCTGFHVTNVVVHGGYIGFSAYECRDVTITDCVSYDNLEMGFNLGENGWEAEEQPTYPHQLVDNVVVTGCEAYGNGLDGFCSDGAVPALVEDRIQRVNNVTYITCYSHDNDRCGFQLGYASNVQMTHCTAEDNAYNAVASGLINNGDGESLDLYSNVIPLGTGRTIHGTTYVGTGGDHIYQALAGPNVPTGLGYLEDIFGTCSGIVED